jgi:hypothetical protein
VSGVGADVASLVVTEECEAGSHDRGQQTRGWRGRDACSRRSPSC